MCPYPDVPASVRGSSPSPPQQHNGAGPQGAHELRAGTGKIPPVKSGGHHAVYPEACNRQKGAHVALPTDVQKTSPC